MVGFRGLDWVYDVTERGNIVATRALAFQQRVEGARCDHRVPSRRGARSIRLRAGPSALTDDRSRLSSTETQAVADTPKWLPSPRGGPCWVA